MKLISKNPHAQTLYYQTLYSAGFDICSNESTELQPGEFKAVGTGLYVDIDATSEHLPMQELQIRPRSGLAFKYGITVCNTPGCVDSDFPNEIKVILINHGKEVFKINPGDRIAQGIVSPVYRATGCVEVKDETRTGGFGSTGK